MCYFGGDVAPYPTAVCKQSTDWGGRFCQRKYLKSPEYLHGN